MGVLYLGFFIALILAFFVYSVTIWLRSGAVTGKPVAKIVLQVWRVVQYVLCLVSGFALVLVAVALVNAAKLLLYMAAPVLGDYLSLLDWMNFWPYSSFTSKGFWFFGGVLLVSFALGNALFASWVGGEAYKSDELPIDKSSENDI